VEAGGGPRFIKNGAVKKKNGPRGGSGGLKTCAEEMGYIDRSSSCKAEGSGIERTCSFVKAEETVGPRTTGQRLGKKGGMNGGRLYRGQNAPSVLALEKV